MLSIGEFSYSTGLSVKTLRYYDEIGLLPAAEVDEHNGYRKYSAHQLDEAALLRVLRAAGMSIAQMKQALTHPHGVAGLVVERRQELEAQRALEDWALAEALRRQDQQPVEVRTRRSPAQAWVGFAASIDVREVHDDVGLGERVGKKIEDTMAAILEVVGEEATTWQEFSSDQRTPAIVDMLWCVELNDAGLEIEVPGIKLIRGKLPAREEAYVRVTVPEEDADTRWAQDSLPGGPLPTQVSIDFTKYLEDQGLDLGRFRMIHRTDDNSVELAATLRAH